MYFSEQLRQQANPIFEGIFHHPFILGIAKGKVPNEALIYYVKADIEFVRAYSSICGHAISKCDNKEEQDFFQKQIEAVLSGEAHPHQTLCRIAGVNYQKLEHHPIPPTAHHYIAHLTKIIQEGNPGEIIAALLPCPWTYLEIGLRLNGKIKPEPDHPFYDWIKFYAELRLAETINKLRDLLDEWAETASEAEKKKASEAFLFSSQLEYMSWEAACSLEKWPFEIMEEEVPL